MRLPVGIVLRQPLRAETLRHVPQRQPKASFRLFALFLHRACRSFVLEKQLRPRHPRWLSHSTLQLHRLRQQRLALPAPALLLALEQLRRVTHTC